MVYLIGRRGCVAKLHGVAPFERKGAPAQRTDLGSRSAGDHIFEVFKLTAVDRVPQGLESGQVHQANPVLKNPFGVGAGLVGIKLLVAVRGVRRNRDLRFQGRCRVADGEGLFYSRILNRLGGRCNAVANRWIVVLSGSDRGFTKDGAAR